MERFVALITGGGLAIVAGFWVTTVAAPEQPLWSVGAALGLVGLGVLAAGIHSQLEY